MKKYMVLPIATVAVFCASLVLAGDIPAPSASGTAAPNVTATPAAATTGAPKIDFDSVTFNFGRVKSGETVKHSFIFTNSGTATLEITEIKPGCGCTTAGEWDKRVEPGKTGTIPLQFNSTGFGGQVSKSAVVTCNDPQRTNLFLQITGTVWKPIDVMPTMAMFNISSEAPPTNETKVLRIVSNLEEPVTLSDLTCNSAAFQTELKEVKPGKEFELLVTTVQPMTNPTVYATITLKSSSTNAPLVTASAYAVVQQPVTVAPQQITLPAGPLKNNFTSAVVVRNNSTNLLELSDIRLDVQGVDLKIAQPQTGRVYSVTVTFPAGFQVQQGQKVELSMKSNHPKMPEIKVPVVQPQPVLASVTSSPGPVASPLRAASPTAAPR